jgi:hypothetical protein
MEKLGKLVPLQNGVTAQNLHTTNVIQPLNMQMIQSLNVWMKMQ